MAMVCPLCNALQTVERACPLCGRIMADGGALENYLGPYSPYQSSSNSSHCFCRHLLYCPQCGYDVRIKLAMVNI